ncbi:MAG: hypothetical protein ABW081_08250, partial [Solirubrobacteraceae bacterium]
MSDEKPPYKVYRSRPTLLSRGEREGIDELREHPGEGEAGDRPDYVVHRSGVGGPKLPKLPSFRLRQPVT